MPEQKSVIEHLSGINEHIDAVLNTKSKFVNELEELRQVAKPREIAATARKISPLLNSQQAVRNFLKLVKSTPESLIVLDTLHAKHKPVLQFLKPEYLTQAKFKHVTFATLAAESQIPYEKIQRDIEQHTWLSAGRNMLRILMSRNGALMDKKLLQSSYNFSHVDLYGERAENKPVREWLEANVRNWRSFIYPPTRKREFKLSKKELEDSQNRAMELLQQSLHQMILNPPARVQLTPELEKLKTTGLEGKSKKEIAELCDKLTDLIDKAADKIKPKRRESGLLFDEHTPEIHFQALAELFRIKHVITNGGHPLNAAEFVIISEPKDPIHFLPASSKTGVCDAHNAPKASMRPALAKNAAYAEHSIFVKRGDKLSKIGQIRLYLGEVTEPGETKPRPAVILNSIDLAPQYRSIPILYRRALDWAGQFVQERDDNLGFYAGAHVEGHLATFKTTPELNDLDLQPINAKLRLIDGEKDENRFNDFFGGAKIDPDYHKKEGKAPLLKIF